MSFFLECDYCRVERAPSANAIPDGWLSGRRERGGNMHMCPKCAARQEAPPVERCPSTLVFDGGLRSGHCAREAGHPGGHFEGSDRWDADAEADARDASFEAAKLAAAKR